MENLSNDFNWECASCGLESTLNPEHTTLVHHPTSTWFDYLIMPCPADDCSTSAIVFIRDAPYESIKPFLTCIWETEDEPDESIVEMFKEAYGIEDVQYHELSKEELREVGKFALMLDNIEPFDL